MGLFGKKDTPMQVLHCNFKDAPFEVKVTGLGVDSQDERYINIHLEITNKTKEILDAYMIGFEFLTVFNEYAGHLGGYSLQDIKPGKAVGVSYHYLIFEAALIGHVCVYPYKNLTKSGEIWMVHPPLVQEKIKEVYGHDIDITVQEDNRRKLVK